MNIWKFDNVKDQTDRDFIDQAILKPGPETILSQLFNSRHF